MADLKLKVQYLQEKLKRDPSPNKILQYFERLDRVPMTLELLQETGIGKTVNNFRKNEGVGSTARDLVQKWKQIVDVEKKNLETPKKEEQTKSQYEKSDKQKLHKLSNDKIDKYSDNHLILENKEKSKSYLEKFEKYNVKYRSPDKLNARSNACDSDDDQNYSKTLTNQQCTLTVETVYNERYDECGQKLGESYERVKKEIGKDKPAKERKEDSSKSKLKESKDHKLKIETENNKIKDKNKVMSSSSTLDSFTNNIMSFEDCLTMGDGKKKSKINKSPEKKSSEKSHSSSYSMNHSSKSSKSHEKKSHRSDKEKSRKSKDDKSVKPKHESTKEKISNEGGKQKSENVTCELLTKKPRYTEIDILSTLPEIQPDYKPLPHRDIDYFSNKKKNVVLEDPSKFTTSRSSRTQVFSGRKNVHLTEVSSLYDMCIKILMENIDSIGCVGYIPFDILKPVLERCNPQQLYHLEDYNPYLMEDTDDIWKGHCTREFRGCERKEFESWRELYLRKGDEREARFKSIKANITASLSKANPVRTIKLAYVDGEVKPPRDVRRKQAKHGTGKLFGNDATKSKVNTVQSPLISSSSASPSSSMATSVSSSKTVIESSPPRVNVNIGTSLSNFSGSHIEKASRPPKTVKVVAPMMQKVRKMMKTHFRR